MTVINRKEIVENIDGIYKFQLQASQLSLVPLLAGIYSKGEEKESYKT